MSDSTSLLDTISTSQAQKEVTANALFDAGSTAKLYARRASTTTALTWGFYGGPIFVGGARSYIANSTVALNASTTNYVEVDTAGVVTVATSQTAGKMLLYKVVTGASTVTSYEDHRSPITMAAFFFQYVAVAMADANQTLTHAQSLCATIECTGALTAGRNLTAPTARRRFVVFNNTTGGFAVTVKTAAGTGIAVAMGDRATVESDGTNIVLIANSASTYVLPTASASVLGGVKVGNGLSIDGSGILSDTESVNSQTGTSYTYVTGDWGKLVKHSNASAIAGSLPQAGASFPDGWHMDVINSGAGTLTITPTTSTIDSQTNLVLTQGQGVRLVSDGANYHTSRGAGGYTLPTASASVLGGVKVGSGLSIDGGGVLSASGSAPSTATLTDFAQDTGTTTGLTYGYQAGRIRDGTTTTNVSAGTIAMTASTTNYVEVSGAGAVSTNTTGFTAGRYPMATVVTDGSSITTVTDKRGVISVASGTIGKHAIYVAAGSMRPSVTGGCAALTAIASAANQPDIVTLDFDTTTQEYAQFSVVMPKKWNEGTVTFKAHWSHAATTTNFGVVWDLQGVAVSDDDAIAVAYGTAQTSTDTGGTTNDLYMSPESSAITIAGTPAAEDMVFFRLSRVTGDAGDTMAIDARLHGITLYVTTAAETDA